MISLEKSLTPYYIASMLMSGGTVTRPSFWEGQIASAIGEGFSRASAALIPPPSPPSGRGEHIRHVDAHFARDDVEPLSGESHLAKFAHWTKKMIALVSLRKPTPQSVVIYPAIGIGSVQICKTNKAIVHGYENRKTIKAIVPGRHDAIPENRCFIPDLGIFKVAKCFSHHLDSYRQWPRCPRGVAKQFGKLCTSFERRLAAESLGG